MIKVYGSYTQGYNCHNTMGTVVSTQLCLVVFNAHLSRTTQINHSGLLSNYKTYILICSYTTLCVIANNNNNETAYTHNGNFIL